MGSRRADYDYNGLPLSEFGFLELGATKLGIVARTSDLCSEKLFTKSLRSRGNCDSKAELFSVKS